MNHLLAALRDPHSVRQLSPAQWDLLVRQTRHANLLGRLYERLCAAGLEADIPRRPRNHLQSGAIMATQQQYSIRREARLLRDALAPYEIPLILLKGAAYVAGRLPAAQGRLFADIDILVPHERLDTAESALMLTGWQSSVTDAYDQRYYRRWMHELPAMRHVFRGTTLDVHHTILPPTARLKPDARLLIEASVEIPDLPGVRTLALEDLILHSASHLFHEGEPDNLLRDLTDLDLLLKHLGRDDAAWDALLARAQRLQLSGPLNLALRYTERLLDTPIPARIRKQAGNGSSGNAGQRLLDLLYSRMLRPQHPSTADRFTSVARKALYIRAHWLRMPPLLLAYHLAHKALFPPKPEALPPMDEKKAA
ncbi:MAG: nucleotidyltransferase family protein [Zoogloea sp.]|uniref:nucleotidyltransferase domain-containing protein n=1 Tax=Zoogloea sp. TaxID=49181 RepID=UPI00260688DA|nr:nucleotidyltransferase family protein [Zoogloea sp.]MDD2988488.1 nucleotidyltransferase family protein [Zoogloea sp.]